MTYPNPGSRPSWAGLDERTADRRPLCVETTLFDRKAGVLDVAVTDLTNLGCRVALDQRITVGSSISLALAPSIDVTGWVAWSIDKAIGVEFAHPLPDALFDAIVEHAAP